MKFRFFSVQTRTSRRRAAVLGRPSIKPGAW